MTTTPGPRAKSRIKSHRDLIVWQKAMMLASASYTVARLLPEDERFGLRQQIQRAAVSVAANIAEGHGRLGKGDFTRHLSIARGSLAELECLVELGVTLGYFAEEAGSTALGIADEVSRMLWVLAKKLGSRQIIPATIPP